jgi:electron transport complex protein RnfB
MNTVLYSVLSLSLLGLFIGIGLAYASKKFHVERDQRVEEVQKALVGSNCGACGFAGCAGAAEAIVKGDAPVDVCLPGAEDVGRKVAAILGVDYKNTKVKKHAVVLCQGTDKLVAKKFKYVGIKTCAAVAKFAAGDKACYYGCLGYGDCLRACKFGAIAIKDGIARVDRDKCTACLLCVKACPKKIIVMVPAKEKRVVLCHSHDTGKVSRTLCSVSCIACGICVKSCPFQAITLDNNLATINYDKCTNCGICEEKCPTKSIRSA